MIARRCGGVGRNGVGGVGGGDGFNENDSPSQKNYIMYNTCLIWLWRFQDRYFVLGICSFDLMLCDL